MMELQLILRLWDPDKSFPNTKYPTKQVGKAIRALFGNLHIGRTSDGRKDGWTKLSIEVASAVKKEHNKGEVGICYKEKDI